MKRIYQEVIDTIPDYQVFLSPDELDESSRALAAEFPDTVTLFEVGATRKGRPLLCLRIGEPCGASGASAGEGIPLPDPQRPAALLLGVPHPNEPIGAMLIEHLSRRLAADADLRRELGYTWYFVKAWDADSLELNTWLKGPFNLTNYSRNIYRPAFYDQVEWTFPIDYKTLHFDAPLPETRAVMALIDAVGPRFVYSLHNSSFGGVYWYETHRTPEIWEEMRAIVADQGLDLHLGEAEVPYAERWAPALYRALSVRDQYDYLERYGEPGSDPAQAIDSGAASFDYACADGQAVGFINEIPYFYSEQIGDLTPTGRTKCDVMLERLDEEEWTPSASARRTSRFGISWARITALPMSLRSFWGVRSTIPRVRWCGRTPSMPSRPPWRTSSTTCWCAASSRRALRLRSHARARLSSPSWERLRRMSAGTAPTGVLALSGPQGSGRTSMRPAVPSRPRATRRSRITGRSAGFLSPRSTTRSYPSRSS